MKPLPEASGTILSPPSGRARKALAPRSGNITSPCISNKKLSNADGTTSDADLPELVTDVMDKLGLSGLLVIGHKESGVQDSIKSPALSPMHAQASFAQEINGVLIPRTPAADDDGDRDVRSAHESARIQVEAAQAIVDANAAMEAAVMQSLMDEARSAACLASKKVVQAVPLAVRAQPSERHGRDVPAADDLSSLEGVESELRSESAFSLMTLPTLDEQVLYEHLVDAYTCSAGRAPTAPQPRMAKGFVLLAVYALVVAFVAAAVFSPPLTTTDGSPAPLAQDAAARWRRSIGMLLRDVEASWSE